VRVEIHMPRSSSPSELEVHSGETVVVGRKPTMDDEGGQATRTVALPVPSVSASHVRIGCDSDGVRIEDLGSRNGTWVRLPPRSVVRFPASESLSVHLAVEPGGSAFEESPADAHTGGAREYVASLERALGAWFSAHDLSVALTVVPRDSTAAQDQSGWFPLPTGDSLVVEPTSTVQTSFWDAIGHVERYLARQNQQFSAAEEMRANGLVVASPAMRIAVARVIDAAAVGARSLLLVGPSGSGKEGLARCFHRHLGRPGPFVARNCALLSKEFARSELFGAEKGAFTGCTQRIIGAVEAANEGTLFLDELAELPRDVQAMLLRFLDHGDFERLGRYGRPSTSDVRLVAATNADLRSAALRDQFRLDLWFRVSAFVVDVPPLRDRFEDVEAFLRGRATPAGGSIHDALSPGALEVLAAHAWDGNFRELVNFANRIVAITKTRTIDADVCRAALAEGALRPLESSNPPRAPLAATPGGMAELASRAEEAFAHDRGDGSPASWDDVKDFVENYLKPLVFAHLGGATEVERLEDVELRATSQRLGADRGTASKQLARYFDRFGQ